MQLYGWARSKRKASRQLLKLAQTEKRCVYGLNFQLQGAGYAEIVIVIAEIFWRERSMIVESPFIIISY